MPDDLSSVDGLTAFANTWVTNTATEAFQNFRLNTVLVGTLQLIKEVQEDGGGSGEDQVFIVDEV